MAVIHGLSRNVELSTLSSGPASTGRPPLPDFQVRPPSSLKIEYTLPFGCLTVPQNALKASTS